MKSWILISALILPLTVNAYPIDMDGNPLFPTDMPSVCEAVGDVTLAAYEYRNDVGQDAVLSALERDWNDVWSKDPEMQWSDYVELQRIIRDAYRTDNAGEFIRQNGQQQTYNEVIACLHENGGW